MIDIIARRIRVLLWLVLSLLLVVFLLAWMTFADASQNALFSPTTGTVSGLQLTNNYNNAIDSVNTANSGAASPVNQLSGGPSLGNAWWDTTDNSQRYYDGTNWIPLGWWDTVNHYWQGLVGGGLQSNIASAATTDLCSQKPYTVNVTGPTTITSFGSNCQVGQVKHIIFTGSLVLTHNAVSLILPNGGNNITTAPGDVAEATYLGSGNWRMTDYAAASGSPLNTSAVQVGASSLTASAQGFNQPLNATIVPTIGANALTITLKDSAGNTPSASTPVLVNFNTTVNSAPESTISITAATSITIPSGATLGTTNGTPFRVWVFLASSGANGILGVATCSNPTTVFACGSFELGANGTAITSGSDNGGTLYVNGATTSYRARILGWVDYTGGLATAGTWNGLPTGTYIFAPGMKKPGDVVQTVFAQTGSNALNSTTTPAASNVTASIAPSSQIDLVRISLTATGNASANGSGNAIVEAQVYRGTSTPLGQLESFGTANTTQTFLGNFAFDIFDAPGTGASTNYTLYFFSGAAAHGVNISAGHIVLDEIMGALEPANDDTPMSMVG